MRIVYPGGYTGLCTPCGIPHHGTRVVYTLPPTIPRWYIRLLPTIPGCVLCPPCYPGVYYAPMLPGWYSPLPLPGWYSPLLYPGGFLSTVPGWYPFYGTRVVCRYCSRVVYARYCTRVVYARYCTRVVGMCTVLRSVFGRMCPCLDPSLGECARSAQSLLHSLGEWCPFYPPGMEECFPF